jgi:hypothetical protein
MNFFLFLKTYFSIPFGAYKMFSTDSRATIAEMLFYTSRYSSFKEVIRSFE